MLRQAYRSESQAIRCKSLSAPVITNGRILTCKGNDIKSHRAGSILAVLVQKVVSGMQQLYLFGTGHRPERATMRPARAAADFNEYHAVPIAHDQIDFAIATAVIARDCSQTPAAQPQLRQSFRTTTCQ